MLLSHQAEFREICQEITGSMVKRIIAAIVCGGGKSIDPVIAAHELIPARADGLCWVTPRNNLRQQGEDNFVEQWLRTFLDHNMEIRAAVNEADPIRDKIGYCTSYQAIVKATTYTTNPHVEVFKRKRMILVLDEIQCVAEGGPTYEALKPLVERASVLIALSGCLSRYDGKRIAFLDYLPADAQGRSFLDLTDNTNQRFVQYKLADATSDHQLIQIFFELRDAAAEWEIKDKLTGTVVDSDSITTFDGASEYETSKGLFAALNTEFFERLLNEATDYWLARKQQGNPRSQYLVVCPTIDAAHRAFNELRRRGVRDVDIATSDDDEGAYKAIARFRRKQRPYLSALVTVGMAYIGMDCPPADVLCCLTHIRSREWIEQMLHRVSRFDRYGIPWEQQYATIFAPEDQFFLDIMAEINAAQAPYVDTQIRQPRPTPPAPPTTKTIPIASNMTTASSHTLDGAPIVNDEHEQIDAALRNAGLFGVMSIEQGRRFAQAMKAQAQQPPPQQAQQQQQPEPEPSPTPSQREAKLRKDIEDFKRSDYSPNDPLAQARLKARGRAIYRMFGKGVDDLTEGQLQVVWEARVTWFMASA